MKTASVGKTQETGWVVVPAPVSHEACTTSIMSVSGLLRIKFICLQHRKKKTSQSKLRCNFISWGRPDRRRLGGRNVHCLHRLATSFFSCSRKHQEKSSVDKWTPRSSCLFCGCSPPPLPLMKKPEPENLVQDFLSSPGPSAFPKQGLICFSTRCMNHAFKLPAPPHKLLQISHRHPLLLSYTLLTCLSPTHSSLFHSLHSSGRRNSPYTHPPTTQSVGSCHGSVHRYLHRQACCALPGQTSSEVPHPLIATLPCLTCSLVFYKVLD